MMKLLCQSLLVESMSKMIVVIAISVLTNKIYILDRTKEYFMEVIF